MRSELINRLEQATGPCRELDARICIGLGLSKDNVMVGVDGWCINSETNPNPYKSPTYTASIDEALTLLPGHRNLTLNIAPFPTHAARIDCPAGSFTAVAPTPALAICIAALKARAHD